jgi:hypothetical protein
LQVLYSITEVKRLSEDAGRVVAIDPPIPVPTYYPTIHEGLNWTGGYLSPALNTSCSNLSSLEIYNMKSFGFGVKPPRPSLGTGGLHGRGTAPFDHEKQREP